MTRLEETLVRALEWVLRLPLLGEQELGRLLRIDEIAARHLRWELERRGWVEWVTAGVAELDGSRRRLLVRPHALPVLQAALASAAGNRGTYPLRQADLLEWLPRLGVAAGVTRLLADLAVVPSGEAGTLVDGLLLPRARPLPHRWWPRAVDGYGSLRMAGHWAPFFVAWDRAGAPDVHRQRRVAAWASDPRTSATDAPLLIVAAGPRAAAVWQRALHRRAANSDSPVPALLTTAPDLLGYGAMGAAWLRTDYDGQVSLLAALPWRSQPLVTPLALPDSLPAAEVPRALPTLRQWAPRAAVSTSRASVRERLAALALATGDLDKRLVEWLARHPFLSADQLRRLVATPEAAIARHLDWLERCRLVRPLQVAAVSESLYVATVQGQRLLAAGDDVPHRLYVRRAGLSALRGAEEAGPGAFAHRLLAHEFGVNAAFVQLHEDARRAGAALQVWRNEAESTHHFRHDERGWWIRPDGSGVLAHGATRWPLLLEYDRGTLDRGHYRGKLAGYRHYYASEGWRQHFSSAPLLLFVCSGDAAERRVAAVVAAEAPELPVLLTTEWRTQPSVNPAGLMDAVWRRSEEASDRRLLPVLKGEESR